MNKKTKLTLKKVTISTLGGEEMKDLVGGATAKCSAWTFWGCNQTSGLTFCKPCFQTVAC